DIVGVRWRGERARVQCRIESGSGCLEQGKLTILVVWNEIFQASYSRHLRKSGELVRERRNVRSRDQELRRVRLDPRITMQTVQRRDRLRIRIAKAVRIEVELQMEQRRQAGQDRNGC